MIAPASSLSSLHRTHCAHGARGRSRQPLLPPPFVSSSLWQETMRRTAARRVAATSEKRSVWTTAPASPPLSLRRSAGTTTPASLFHLFAETKFIFGSDASRMKRFRQKPTVICQKPKALCQKPTAFLCTIYNIVTWFLS
ncbi:MAG: hypothetical protein BJ554DRAFT_484 [Olpidium bornovanus]|uniref:Uncharacterized protein n=1 Tax=Olpidium bornovanus TaxID=278681 RepID=A0A8H7ZTY3_9FUNG|nr:MAG: hypothetical protein BJ554DRAFT_484 [Olpidium bornovanus]